MDEMNYQLDLLKAMNEKLSGSDKMFRMICGTSSNAFLFYSFKDNRFETLGSWEQYFDFNVTSVSDFQNMIGCVKGKYASELERVLYCERTGEETMSLECELPENNKWVEFEVTISYDGNGNPSEKIVRIRDITKTKRQNEDLKYMAYYDALTGLYNRFAWKRFCQKYYNEKNYCVVMIDMDGLKKINDGFGHLTGNNAICITANVIKNAIDEEDLVIRYGGDEFQILSLNVDPEYWENMRDVILKMLNDSAEEIVDRHISDDLEPAEWDMKAFSTELQEIFPVEEVTLTELHHACLQLVEVILR